MPRPASGVCPEGLHHITAITADAPRNVEFYARTLGLRLVKKTVNFDQPDVYHLYYGDEVGAAGSILTFFELPGAQPGRHGDGMVHTIEWRVGSTESLAFWSDRLAAAGVEVSTPDGGGDAPPRRLAFADPEGLRHELVAVAVPDAPLVAHADDVPPKHALRGFEGVSAYAADQSRSTGLLERLGFVPGAAAGSWTARGEERHAHLLFEPSPGRGVPGAGTIHHVAWSLADDAELEHFRALAVEGGAQPTPIIDRQYFHSVYFRMPGHTPQAGPGVLFELASRDIGFDVDEPRESLGSALKLPAQYESQRERIERVLTPIVNPRQVS